MNGKNLIEQPRNIVAHQCLECGWATIKQALAFCLLLIKSVIASMVELETGKAKQLGRLAVDSGCGENVRLHVPFVTT